jgi:pre-rRNA-processing protein TSR1
MNRFFPAIEKVYSLESTQECLNMLRIVCTTLPKGIHWREERPWLVAENIVCTPVSSTDVDVQIIGVVRAKPFKADRLVQLGIFGPFQVSKVTAVLQKDDKKHTTADAMAVEESEPRILDLPSENADPLQDLAELLPHDEEELAAIRLEASQKHGVLIDDDYFEDQLERVELKVKPKRLPRGTSAYQAAWYIGNESDSGSDLESVSSDEDLDDMPFDVADGALDIDMAELEIAPSEAAETDVMMDDDDVDDRAELATYDADDDLKFPDEVELHPNELARETLAEYRGLKNFRTSVWDTRFDPLEEPENWNRLLEISNYKAARNRVLNGSLVGQVEPGTRICIHISNVPNRFADTYGQGKRPMALYQLLQHEGKRTALHFSITLDSQLSEPVKSKDELLVVCGPRIFAVNALFSDPGNTPNDVHKFRRFLHPGQAGVASFVSHLTWGSVPALFFSHPDPESMSKHDWQFAGKGTSLPPSTSRVIAERIVLTGHPVKIHKRVATIRWMFFNVEDVTYFRGLRLWTKGGRSGFIKESLGTHGRFKAEFDGKIDGMEMIGVSLYKRIWPDMYSEAEAF